MDVTITSTLLFIGWTLCAILAIAANRDIFSPAKFFVLYLAVFFGDIFVTQYRLEIVLIYACLLLTAALLVAIEHRLIRGAIWRHRANSAAIDGNHLRVRHALLWFLSLVPIAAQVYLIHLTGGIVEYINVIGMRVLEFRGMGALLTLIKIYPVISILYFGVLLLGKTVKRSDWILFIAHFVIFILIALLSGSRGFLLSNLVLMIVLYHYSRKRVGILMASVVVPAFLATAWLIGVARTGYQVDEGQIRTGLDQEYTEQSITTSQYGLIPLNLVVTSDHGPRLQYGLTFLTALTNIVPRGVWPEKPDSGGVVLTKHYLGDAWQGGTYLSTGILTEGMLNFGIAPGLLFGVASLLAALVLIEYWYVCLLRRLTGALTGQDMIQLLTYIVVMRSVVGLLFAEFTNTAVSTLFFVGPLLFVAIAYGLLRRRNHMASIPSSV